LITRHRITQRANDDGVDAAVVERLVRRLWVLKVWGDVVDDGRGDGPLDPADVLAERREQDFAPESIGKLTQPVDLVGWERRVRQRFTFLVLRR
jgi:predicted nucleotidyltransferase component of viral defense system